MELARSGSAVAGSDGCNVSDFAGLLNRLDPSTGDTTRRRWPTPNLSRRHQTRDVEAAVDDHGAAPPARKLATVGVCCVGARDRIPASVFPSPNVPGGITERHSTPPPMLNFDGWQRSEKGWCGARSAGGALNLLERRTRGNCESGTKRSGGMAIQRPCATSWRGVVHRRLCATHRLAARDSQVIPRRAAGGAEDARAGLYTPRAFRQVKPLLACSPRAGLYMLRRAHMAVLYTPVLLNLPGRSRRPSLRSAVNDTATFRGKGLLLIVRGMVPSCYAQLPMEHYVSVPSSRGVWVRWSVLPTTSPPCGCVVSRKRVVRKAVSRDPLIPAT